MHTPTRVLIVEDDPGQREAIRDYLTLSHFQVLEAATAEEGLKHARDNLVDIILVDWILPGMSGLSFCSRVREQGFAGAVVMITCKSDLDNQVEGLVTGADDYLVKPVPLKLIKAKIEALVRRRELEQIASPQVQVGEAVFDRSQSRLQAGEQSIQLTSKEAGILHLLVIAQGGHVSRERILGSVWKYDYLPNTRSVDNYILSLRRKLAVAAPSIRLVTRRSLGYALEQSGCAKASASA